MPANKNIARSFLCFAILVLITLINVIYGQRLAHRLPGIRVWDYTMVLLLLLAVPCIWMQSKAGLPDLYESSIPNRQRVYMPFGIGVFFGLLDVLVVKAVMHPQSYESMPSFLQPFPYSVFLYISGAVDVEIFYRLIPITAMMLLVGKLLLKGKYDDKVFLITAILISLREPIEQWQSEPLWFMFYALFTGFTMNFLQAVYYKKAGFLASLFLRLGHYTVWHILLGIYVQYAELAK